MLLIKWGQGFILIDFQPLNIVGIRKSSKIRIAKDWISSDGIKRNSAEFRE